jgi:HD-like signal output (HDOD) protein
LAHSRAAIINSGDIPTVPTVVARLLTVVASDTSSSRELIEVVGHDQALTARILRLANSAFFGFSRDIGTLRRAVMVLGFDAVRNFALGVKIWDTLLGAGKKRGLEMWNHAALVALAARQLGHLAHLDDPEGAFIAGLLHDIGRVVLQLRFPAEYAGVDPATGCDADALRSEVDAVGANHCQAGGWLAEAWLLPDPIILAAATHHQVPTPGAQLDIPLVVNLANRLVRSTNFDDDKNPLDVNDAVAPLLELGIAPGLTAESWQRIAAALRPEKDELRHLFAGDR